MADMYEDSTKRRRLDEDGTSADAGAELRKENITKWIKPLNVEQLTQLIVDIGAANAAAYDEIHKACNDIAVNKKIFVRGLAWETSDTDLLVTFQQYGEITEATVVMDKQTGKSKGYGFVTFKTMDAAYAALEQPEKSIGGRPAQCNLAAVRQGQTGSNAMANRPQQAVPIVGTMGTEDITLRKLFIRGLSWDTTSVTLRNVFSQFGELEDVVVTTDRQTGKSRGFGFVTFTKAVDAQSALVEPEKQIDGRLTHCNLAAQGAKNNQAQGQGQAQGMGMAANNGFGGMQQNAAWGPNAWAAAAQQGWGAYGQQAGFGAQAGYGQGWGTGYGTQQGYATGFQQT